MKKQPLVEFPVDVDFESRLNAILETKLEKERLTLTDEVQAAFRIAFPAKQNPPMAICLD